MLAFEQICEKTVQNLRCTDTLKMPENIKAEVTLLDVNTFKPDNQKEIDLLKAYQYSLKEGIVPDPTPQQVNGERYVNYLAEKCNDEIRVWRIAMNKEDLIMGM